MERALLDPATAGLAEPLVATLGFLKKMTLTPDDLGPDDALAVLRTGVSPEALRDAIHVAYLFNVYDRLADTMGWHVPEGEGAYAAGAKNLLSRGYVL